MRADNMGPKAHSKGQKTDVADDQEEGAVGGMALTTHEREENPVPTDISSIVGLLQQCLQSQRDLNERWDKEAVKQEKRWRQMQIQMNNLRDDLEEQQQRESPPQQKPPPPPQPDEEDGNEDNVASQSNVRREQPGKVWGKAVVPKLEENDDIEQYLTTFERLAVAYQWPEVEWAVRLVPHLSEIGRAHV